MSSPCIIRTELDDVYVCAVDNEDLTNQLKTEAIKCSIYLVLLIMPAAIAAKAATRKAMKLRGCYGNKSGCG